MEWTLLHYKYTFLKSFWGKHLFTILWLTKKKVTLDNGRMWRYEKFSLFKHECYLGKSQHFTYSPIFCKLEGFWTLQSCFKFHGNILVSLQSLFADVCVICEIEASYIVTWTQVNLLKLLVAFLLAYCIFLLSCLHCHLWFSSGLCFFFVDLFVHVSAWVVYSSTHSHLFYALFLKVWIALQYSAFLVVDILVRY